MNSPKNLPSIGQEVRLIDTHPRAGQVGIVVDRPWLPHGLAAKVRLSCGKEVYVMQGKDWEASHAV